MFGRKADRISELKGISNSQSSEITGLVEKLYAADVRYGQVYKQYQEALTKISEAYAENHKLKEEANLSADAYNSLDDDYDVATGYLDALREQHQDLQNRYDLLEALLKQLNVPVKLPVRKTTK